ncbi:MAG: prephenate dehydratase domain-containing protein [Clostridia bacterium]|nr:prephenate dehydratase domain-containing protein [Clostridia bacterium]
MDKLQKARKMINEIDAKMSALFCARMEAAKLVAEHKQEHGLPIFDKAREQIVIENNAKLVEDDEIRSYYINFLKYTMKLSRQYQHMLISGMKVAYSGVEGAFAHIAAGKIFPDANLIPYSDFDSAYEAVVAGECDCAVMPIENSYAGEVGQVLDLMFKGSLYINGVYDLEVSQNLIGLPNSRLSDIREVVSHPQALMQCAGFIKENGFEQIQEVNTAIAAQKVAEGGDKSVAAIAGKETADLYGLKIIEKDINESSFNTTRFAVFSRAQNMDKAPGNHFLMLFTVGHVAGALAKAIHVIGRHGFNMRVLRSRPVKDSNWQYYFYVEAEGNVNSEEGQKMLDELKEYCEQLKVVGNYSNQIVL